MTTESPKPAAVIKTQMAGVIAGAGVVEMTGSAAPHPPAQFVNSNPTWYRVV